MSVTAELCPNPAFSTCKPPSPPANRLRFIATDRPRPSANFLQAACRTLLVCDPQQVRQSGGVRNKLRRLEVRALLRLTEPRSGAPSIARPGDAHHSSGRAMLGAPQRRSWRRFTSIFWRCLLSKTLREARGTAENSNRTPREFGSITTSHRICHPRPIRDLFERPRPFDVGNKKAA